MKKILGIIGSPRKLGNCEIMVKEIGRQITAPHEMHLLRLTEFNLLPCRGCYACLFKEEKCVQQDDFQRILESILEADALIVAAPTYFLGANASLKRLLDRGLAFYAHIDKLWGKPAVGVAIAGIPGKEGYTLLGIQNFLKMTLTEIKQTRMETDGPVFRIRKSGHELFLSKEEALHHKEWLLQMKARYLEQKEKLKEITLAYRKPEEWIRPNNKGSGAGVRDQKERLKAEG